MNFYELYLRSFFDGNKDGIGDFKGLNEKLDYFTDLGIDTVWLLPIMTSPAFHGYTISDFFNVNPAYGSIEDLKQLLNNAHKKGLKFILDVPVNHCAVNSEWFQKALNGDSQYIDYFLWANEKTDTDEPRHWGGDKIWHKIKDKYFYGLFGPGSPDLNFENKKLWAEMKNVFKFWLDIGFDGFRLDAAKHIFDYDSENMIFKYQHEKNITFWKEMLSYIKSLKDDAIIVSEVWDDSSVVKKYEGVFEIGFNFPFSYDLKNSVKKESPSDFIKGLKNSMPDYLSQEKEIKTKSGNFLTNHDMTRLVSEMENSLEKAKLALSILYTLPGYPFIYYGEEIGMKGILESVNFTEDGEEPFQWYENGFGPGQTEWKGYKFNPPYSGFSEESEKKEENSMLSHTKRLLKFRKENQWITDSKIKIIKENENMTELCIYNGKKNFTCIYNFKPCELKIETSSDIIFSAGKTEKNYNSLLLGPYSMVVVAGK